MFAASLSGRAGIAPSTDEAAPPLRFMVKAIDDERVVEFGAFDHDGNVRQFC